MTDTATLPAVYSANDPLRVFEGINLVGRLNVEDDVVVAQITQAIRRGHPQLPPPSVMHHDTVCLVGGGPSLAETEGELVDLVRQGALLVTTNGAYEWCLSRNLVPNAQIVLDARASSARFLRPALPKCRYYLASQCHRDVWDAVDGRPFVCVFHAVNNEVESPAKKVLDDFYLGNWLSVPCGTTVGIRAISLLRMLGYVRFEVFGLDGCWLGDLHHAFAQPENEEDRRYRLALHPVDAPELRREFVVSTWHLQQLQDFLQLVKLNGQHFLLNLHGDGLLRYALESAAQLETAIEPI